MTTSSELGRQHQMPRQVEDAWEMVEASMEGEALGPKQVEDPWEMVEVPIEEVLVEGEASLEEQASLREVVGKEAAMD